MEPAEISQLITELEERVERLRSLYDQYFMGIERLEPTILRKDVDRRLWALRREQIRNTGLRFKLETTIQRYNTYQQYWQRIVREIENGTYQRDLGRAAQRFGENAVTAFAKRRQKMFEKGQAKKAEREAQRQARLSAPPDAQNAETSDADASANESYDVAFDDSDMIEQPPLSLDLGTISQAAKPMAASQPHAPSPLAAKPLPKGPPTREAVGLTAVSPGTLRDVAATAAPADPPGASPPGPLRPAAPALRSPTGALPRPAAPPPRQPAPPAAPLPPRPFTPSPPRAPAPPATAPTPSPAAAQAPPAAPPRPPAPSVPDDGLSATRLRQIYGQYVEAKRKANESTAAITFEKVAANLRQTVTQLQGKHKGTIDFEVVMKNGKPVLKPVVK